MRRFYLRLLAHTDEHMGQMVAYLKFNRIAQYVHLLAYESPTRLGRGHSDRRIASMAKQLAHGRENVAVESSFPSTLIMTASPSS